MTCDMTFSFAFGVVVVVLSKQLAFLVSWEKSWHIRMISDGIVLCYINTYFFRGSITGIEIYFFISLFSGVLFCCKRQNGQYHTMKLTKKATSKGNVRLTSLIGPFFLFRRYHIILHRRLLMRLNFFLIMMKSAPDINIASWKQRQNETKWINKIKIKRERETIIGNMSNRSSSHIL